MPKTLSPNPDRVIAKATKPKETTEGGLLLPKESQSKLVLAEVLAVGENIDWIHPGDMIVHVEFGPEPFTHEGQEVLIMREDDVLAVETTDAA